MMRFKHSCFAILLYIAPIWVWAGTETQSKTCTATRTSISPHIDGKTDEPAWANATIIRDFVQMLPNEGAPASQKTEVKILYDNYAIYVSAHMYDDHPDSILRELGQRDDDGLNADYFMIQIDPYNTRQDAFCFGLYASGVQNDFKISDNSFDAVWASAVSIDKDGWTIEMRIPYSALRFPKTDEQHWAIEIMRQVRRTREKSLWVLTPNNQANPLKFWGMMDGLKNIACPIRLSLTPYVSFGLQRSPQYNADNTYFYSNALTYGGGADIKYGIDERFTLDMTLYPDFSQVQSDKKVKNLSYREITYTENRPFFKEGTDLFNKGGLFYSRRIGEVPVNYYNVPNVVEGNELIEDNPSQSKLLNATKVSGRTNGGLGIGVLNAVIGDTYATLKEDSTGKSRKYLTEPATDYNVIVFDQQLRHSSDLYFINTFVGRDNKYRNADVIGAGFNFNNKANSYNFFGDAAVSQIFNKSLDAPDKTINTAGYKYDIGFGKISGRWQYFVRHELGNNTFDSRDIGYKIINNYIVERAHVEYDQFVPKGNLRYASNSIDINHSDNFHTQDPSYLGISYNSFETLLNFHSFFFGVNVIPISGHDYNEPRTAGRYYQTPSYYNEYIGISSDYRRKLAIDMTLTEGSYLANNPNHFPLLPNYSVSLNIRYRFSDKLSITPGISYSIDPYNVGYTDTSAGRIIIGARMLTSVTNTISGRYIFMNNMSLTLNVRHYWNKARYEQFNALQNNGSLQKVTDYTQDADFNYNVFNIDLVFSWMFAPGSTVSIIYKNALEKQDQNLMPIYLNDLNATLASPQINSVSVKLLYYLDYLYLHKKPGSI